MSRAREANTNDPVPVPDFCKPPHSVPLAWVIPASRRVLTTRTSASAQTNRLKELGYSDEDVAMALVVVPSMAGNGARGERPSLDDLTAFLENRRKMQGMGFSKQAICGALMEFKNDLEDAIAHCAGFA